ncbi:recombinase family protein [Listeria innocua]|uniref:recombinase family protein n=1 Tax=Listeria innocua TaxID=1642 RepID=UPI0021AB98C1|nr:recombinase family protein [Listeria innocua]
MLKQGIEEDYLYIGKKTATNTRKREALKELIKNSREGDIVYITKIDYLARSMI